MEALLPARSKNMTAPEVQTEYLVVGAGPAGASLACFLGQNGKQTRAYMTKRGTYCNIVTISWTSFSREES